MTPRITALVAILLLVGAPASAQVDPWEKLPNKTAWVPIGVLPSGRNPYWITAVTHIFRSPDLDRPVTVPRPGDIIEVAKLGLIQLHLLDFATTGDKRWMESPGSVKRQLTQGDVIGPSLPVGTALRVHEAQLQKLHRGKRFVWLRVSPAQVPPLRYIASQLPIVDQLRPGEKAVEVVRDIAIDVVTPDHPLTPMQALSMAVAHAEQVLLIELTNADAVLIDHGRWIATRLRSTVVEVIKAKKASALKPGADIVFEIGGGQLTVNGVAITAGPKASYQRGQQYLAFLRDKQSRVDDPLTSNIDGPRPVLVEKNRLINVEDDRDQFGDLTLADVRRAASRRY